MLKYLAKILAAHSYPSNWLSFKSYTRQNFYLNFVKFKTSLYEINKFLYPKILGLNLQRNIYFFSKNILT